MRLVLSGQRGGQPVELVVTLPAPAGQDPAVDRVWAQARLADLLDQMGVTPDSADRLRAEIVGLALAYNLVRRLRPLSPSIQSRPLPAGQPQVIHVAVPLPKGLAVEPFLRGLPPLASSKQPSPGMASARSGPAKMVRDFLNRQVDEGQVFQAKTAMFGRGVAEPSALPVEPQAAAQPKLNSRESGLRWLARTQNLDGSLAK